MYYYELRSLKDKTAQVPSIQYVEITGHNDISYEVSSLVVEVVGKGRLEFNAPSVELFDHESYIAIRQIGPWRFRVRNYAPRLVRTGPDGVSRPVGGLQNFVMIGSEGPLESEFDFEITSIHDVVDHYDEIIAKVEGWYADGGVVIVGSDNVAYDITVIP